MSDTTITTGSTLAKQKYSDLLFSEYLDQLVLTGYMSTDSNAVIHVKEDLMKEKGEAVNCPLMKALTGAGITGESTLEGYEEAINFYSQKVTLTEYTNAVRDSGNLARQRSAFDLFDQFKPELTSWLAQKSEDLCFAAMSDAAGTAYGSASESAKDTDLAANSDRILFGAATTNNASNDHSAALLQIDTTTDILATTQISLAKRMAQLANPKIRPIRIQGGLEFFVMFCHPYCVRDLKASTAWQSAQRDALPRGLNNPLFTGAVGYWDGVLIVETPKILLLDNVGTSTSDVAMNLLCGAQSVIMAQGGYESSLRIKMVEKDFDYGRQKGVAIMTMQKFEKAYYNSVNHGLVKVFSSAAAD